VPYLEENYKNHVKPKRRIMIIIAMIESQREFNTIETTSTHIFSLKPHITNINRLNDKKIWFRRRLSCMNI